jgi:hypothetical protein
MCAHHFPVHRALALPHYIDLLKVKANTSATDDLVEITVEKRDSQAANKEK